MASKTVTKKLLSLAETARKANVPYPRALQLLDQGIWRPDCMTGRVHLFRESRLEELRAAVAFAHGLARPRILS